MENKTQYIFNNLLIKLILVCFFTSCEGKKNHSEKIENNYAIIYYVPDGVTSTSSINCEDFIDSLNHFIFYLKIEDIHIINKLMKNVSREKIINNYEKIDTRYRVEFEETVMCFDSFGYYTLNGVYMGKCDTFEVLLEYIKENRIKSIKLQESPRPIGN